VWQALKYCIHIEELSHKLQFGFLYIRTNQADAQYGVQVTRSLAEGKL
jgi:hypothetical protein